MMMMMMIKLRTSRYLDVSQLLALLPSLLWSVTVVRTKFRPDTVGAPCQLVHRCSLSRNGTQPSPQPLDTLSNNIVPNISLSRHFSYIFSYKCETKPPSLLLGWSLYDYSTSLKIMTCLEGSQALGSCSLQQTTSTGVLGRGLCHLQFTNPAGEWMILTFIQLHSICSLDISLH